jgi:hypothetical protein
MHVPTSFDAHISSALSLVLLEPPVPDYLSFSDLIMGLAVPSIIFIVLILGAYAWAAWNPVSRPHLNRVSFRLLVYALIAKYKLRSILPSHIADWRDFSLAYAVGMISGTKLKAGAACNGSTFFYNVRFPLRNTHPAN